jgi:hypothetical protein
MMPVEWWRKAAVALALVSSLVLMAGCGKNSEEADDAEDSTAAQAGEFHGYTCTEDCSGHEAGYAWAEEHDITDPDQCGGNSESFIEGCRAYAEENE